MLPKILMNLGLVFNLSDASSISSDSVVIPSTATLGDQW